VSRAGLIPPVRASTAPAVMAPPPESERPLTPVKALIDGEVSPEAPRAAIARAFQSHRLTEKLHEERAAKELADRLRAEREEAARQKAEAARLEKQRLAARWSHQDPVPSVVLYDAVLDDRFAVHVHRGRGVVVDRAVLQLKLDALRNAHLVAQVVVLHLLEPERPPCKAPLETG